MANERGNAGTGADAGSLGTGNLGTGDNNVQDFNEYFRGRVGGGEMYRPSPSSEPSRKLAPVKRCDLVRQDTPPADMPARMARSYYLMMFRRVALHILEELDDLAPDLQAALDAEIGDPKTWIDGEPPAKSTSDTWLFHLYLFRLADGDTWVELYDVSPEAQNFVNRLADWAERYYLEPWIIEEMLEAMRLRSRAPGRDWGWWLEHLWTSHACPLEPEVHTYRAPEDVTTAMVPTIRVEGDSGRALEFVHPGYRPSGMSRTTFMDLCREQFEEALKHYVEGVERDYADHGYVRSPEMRDVKKFEWAVLRRNLGWSLEQIEGRYYVSQSAISEGIKEVERVMGVPSLKGRVIPPRPPKRGERLPK